eukprot:COSAG04_NODE_23422_length_338_cov_2.794979_1_plen_25_part_10
MDARALQLAAYAAGLTLAAVCARPA